MRTGWLVSTIGVLLLIIVSVLPAYSSEGWESNITVSAGDASNNLSFGQKIDATEGIDGYYDVKAMLGGNIKAYFILSGGQYWRDIRSVTSTESWELNIDSSQTGEIVTIKWNPDGLPEANVINLLDKELDVIIDMHIMNKYTYVNNGHKILIINTK